MVGLAITQPARLAIKRMDRRGNQHALLPFQIHRNPSTRPQPLDTPGWPGLRQRRQHLQHSDHWTLDCGPPTLDFGLRTLDFGLRTLDFFFIALQQHFADTGSAAEVAVYLK